MARLNLIFQKSFSCFWLRQTAKEILVGDLEGRSDVAAILRHMHICADILVHLSMSQRLSSHLLHLLLDLPIAFLISGPGESF